MERDELICPHCNGHGVLLHHFDRLMCMKHEPDEECDCKADAYTCPTCRGAKKIGQLAFAIYKARGGPAPVKLRGFA